MRTVGEDGICKVNFYTAMARGASVSVKSGWDQAPSGEPLPIPLACGSTIHATRRGAFAETTRTMLDLLAGQA